MPQSLPSTTPRQITVKPTDPRRLTPAQVFADGDSFGTTLLVIALDLFGPDFLDWSPISAVADLEETTGVAIPGANVDKLNAAVRLLTTNEFFTSLPDFLLTCNVLSNKSLVPETTDPVAEPAEVAWGVCEAMLLTPLDAREFEFSPDICKYTGMLLDNAGFARTPSVLGFADRAEPDVTDVDADLQELTVAVADERVSDVEREVQENLESLVHQLSRLALYNGSTRGALEAIQKRVREFSDAIN